MDTADPAQDEASKTLTGQAYETLRRAIVAGTLAPGAKLQADTLKAEFGFSGTTLREALTRLIGTRSSPCKASAGFGLHQSRDRTSPISAISARWWRSRR